MTTDLSSQELVALIRRVFMPRASDRRLAILVDMPDEKAPDHPLWLDRRILAAAWHEALEAGAAELGIEGVDLVLYRNPRANNADLPEEGYLFRGGELPTSADNLAGQPVRFSRLFTEYQLFLAPTEFSATAPLKVAAREYGFRAATMPGFSRAMVPALRLDYGVIGARVDQLKRLLDGTSKCDIRFGVGDDEYRLTLDLRHRTSHASGGVFSEPGVAGNLPSGETYIVPYEGELEGDSSRSRGKIPVQFGDEVVVYRIVENVATSIASTGTKSDDEAQRLRAEPAYGNIAELGLGVLGDFGLQPSGSILLDEKLGLHIAFGRSEHFGGQVGPKDFTSPDRVVHIDRVYIPALQPRIRVIEAVLTGEDGALTLLMRDGEYQVVFDR